MATKRFPAAVRLSPEDAQRLRDRLNDRADRSGDRYAYARAADECHITAEALLRAAAEQPIASAVRTLVLLWLDGKVTQ